VPVIKSAKKKLRQDKKRQEANNILRNALKVALKDAQKSKTQEKVILAVKLADKALKKNLIHKNKAARIKSKLSRLIKTSSLKTKSSVKPAKKSKTSKIKK
jgi:small subunit ribosomal protein S20